MRWTKACTGGYRPQTPRDFIGLAEPSDTRCSHRFCHRRRGAGPGQSPSGCRAAAAQEALPHPWRQSRSALGAEPLFLDGDIGICGGTAIHPFARHSRGIRGSLQHTLMRHGAGFFTGGRGLLLLEHSPSARALGMLGSSAAAVLVSAASVALELPASLLRAPLVAVALAVIATATENDGLATASAQKHASNGIDQAPLLRRPTALRLSTFTRPSGRRRQASPQNRVLTAE